MFSPSLFCRWWCWWLQIEQCMFSPQKRAMLLDSAGSIAHGWRRRLHLRGEEKTTGKAAPGPPAGYWLAVGCRLAPSVWPHASVLPRRRRTARSQPAPAPPLQPVISVPATNAVCIVAVAGAVISDARGPDVPQSWLSTRHLH
jgi:hypothetical protein